MRAGYSPKPQTIVILAAIVISPAETGTERAPESKAISAIIGIGPTCAPLSDIIKIGPRVTPAASV